MIKSTKGMVNLFFKKSLFFIICMLLSVSICFSMCVFASETENIAPLQKFIVYAISLEENPRIEVTDVLKTCISTWTDLDKKAEKLLQYFPEMTYDEVFDALHKYVSCTSDGANSLCDLILFGPTVPQYRDNMPNIISNINYNITGNKDDHRGSTFFYSLLKAYNLYTIFGGNPYIATNMSDLPGLVDMDIKGLSYDISKRVSTAITLMPSLEKRLESYGQDTMMGNLLKMSEECANNESTEEIYYFKASLSFGKISAEKSVNMKHFLTDINGYGYAVFLHIFSNRQRIA